MVYDIKNHSDDNVFNDRNLFKCSLTLHYCNEIQLADENDTDD